METRKRPIQVRPRRGSNLERKQDETNNNMAEVLHGWADYFARTASQSDKTGDDDDRS